jgi:hypothetical protein
MERTARPPRCYVMAIIGPSCLSRTSFSCTSMLASTDIQVTLTCKAKLCSYFLGVLPLFSCISSRLSWNSVASVCRRQHVGPPLHGTARKSWIVAFRDSVQTIHTQHCRCMMEALNRYDVNKRQWLPLVWRWVSLRSLFAVGYLPLYA